MAGPTPSVGNSMGVSLDALMAKFDQLIQATNAEAAATKALTAAYTAYLNKGQLPGTTTNDNANAGNVGEFITATWSGVSPTASVWTNATSITLTPGDWDVSATNNTTTASGTTSSIRCVTSSIVSATPPSAIDYGLNYYTISGGMSDTLLGPPLRYSVSTATTCYALVYCTYTSSTITMAGRIRARRIR